MATAGVSTYAKGGQFLGYAGKGALALDAAGNASAAGQGLYDMGQQGLTWENGLQTGTAALGMGGNYSVLRTTPTGQAFENSLYEAARRTGPYSGYSPSGLGALQGLPGRPKRPVFQKPHTVRSAKGIEGRFRENGWTYRIDTNKVQPGEGGFHLHVYQNGQEVAKINGRGGYVVTHGGHKPLLRPNQVPNTVRNDITRLIEHVNKNLE